jgi:hypothetical protein
MPIWSNISGFTLSKIIAEYYLQHPAPVLSSPCGYNNILLILEQASYKNFVYGWRKKMRIFALEKAAIDPF